MKRIKELLLPLYVILNLIYISLGSILFTYKKIKYIDYSKGYIVFLILNILVLITMFIFKKIKKQKINLNITDIFLLLIIIFSIISVIFSINKNVSIFGFKGRYEGLLTILYYFSIYLISTNIEKKYKKIIIYFLLFIGIINTIYAVFQILEIKGIMIRYNNKKPWATGFVNNPNFYGILTLLCISYSIGLFIDEERIQSKIIYGLLIFIFMIGLLISNGLSSLVGLIIVLIYILIYIIKNKKLKEFIIIILILLTSILLITKADKTTLIKDLVKTKNETIEITKGNLNDKYGTNRVFIWKNTIKRVPHHILTGAGIDNFYYAFGEKPLKDNKWTYDKAHNEYLQILITEGIFALISYLLLFGWITIKGTINNYKNKEIYLILPVIGYLVQAFFNISVIEVAPFFYISLGLLVDRGISNEKSKYNNTST
ncbi:MAG: O-antigen ligase family protein [Bacilli bacterium]